MPIRQTAIFLLSVLILTSCQANLANIKKEGEEAVINLAEEEIQTKENIETKVNQFNNLVDAVDDTTSSIKAITGNE
jgi:hypothetical protein